MASARDLILAGRAKRHGAKPALRIIWEARAAGLPISVAFALVEHESGFRNIFGGDAGGMFRGLPVTRARVRAMVAAVRKGRTSNGVGYPQITWSGYLYEAERLGGAHLPKYQLRVAFKALAGLIKQYGHHEGFRRYNGTGPAARVYADRLTADAKRWHGYL